MNYRFALILFPSLLYCGMIRSQVPDWSTSIASIIYENCTPCHRPGEVAPFSLLSYNDALTNGSEIKEQTSAGLMPPWPADPSYRHYLDEQVLSAAEVDLITAWVDGGMPEGDTALAPDIPAFSEGSQLGTPDAVLSMASSYYTTPDNKDRYMVFVLPGGFTEDQNVSAIEFRPGNKSIVHHVFIYSDTTGSVAALDSMTPEYGFEGFSPTIFSSADFITLYRPGMQVRLLPPELAFRIPAGADILFQIHYAPVDYVTTDSSSVNIFFNEEDSVRYVMPLKVTEAKLTEPALYIPANTVETFHTETVLDDGDQSWISISPHAHQLCTSFKVFGINPSGDTIPLVFIPKWSFDWQLLYNFTWLQKMEEGTLLFSEGTFDNTSNNPNNPNNPPQDVHYGLGSGDEMFRYFFMAVPYAEGDEDMVLDSSVFTMSEPSHGIVSSPQLYPVVPNPVRDVGLISYFLPQAQRVSLRVCNLLGIQVLDEKLPCEAAAGFHQQTLSTSGLAPGCYFLILSSEQGLRTKKFVVE